ncbi:MAG: transcription termination/antitermination protein NusA [Ruminococcaceae bacterium]|nr:transcription termination/antitermination protein NusA [Oscillospiraceae bacterium]MBO4972315.1 transcription termination/antitermination protein NusA [Clostridia bacterium]MBQ1259507.1 transcription termination/antitermination protein NusA [Clostridia bacterium]
MNKEFFRSLELLEQEYGIDKDYMVDKIKAAMVSALKKEYDKPNIEVRVQLNSEKEDLQFFRQRTVVEEVVNDDVEISLEEAKRKSKRYKVGDIFENEIKAKDLKRVSVGAARQVIVHNIREAQKQMLQQSYEKRREEIVSAVVDKIDRDTGDVIIDLGDHKAILSLKEQIPGEKLEIGQSIRVFIQEVDRRANGVSVTISRKHTGFLRRLFELEVPEIASGDVVLASIARDPGSRSKVAVYSRVEGIDAIGACIGQNKSRIEGILSELAGEKVDVIGYSEDKVEYIKSALLPATVKAVVMLDTASAKVYVAPEQLSLAIGRGGQNARLAAKLTGCKIDITGDSLEIEV